MSANRSAPAATPLPTGLRLLERGWLSSNNILLLGDDEATVVDTGYVLHADQTEALVRAAAGGRRVSRIVNTHVHSDHCGGNARLQAAFGAEVAVPVGIWDAVARWDEVALTYAPTGQRCARFTAQRSIAAGDCLRVGGRCWEALAAPGHDPDGIVLFDAGDGVLISADALWENGFGVVFPELEGQDAFDQVAAVLELIDRLPVRLVLPGHGPAFGDAASALARARQRLAGMRADPRRHALHAAKVLLKFHLLEWRARAFPALLQWARGAALLPAIRSRHFAHEPMDAWLARLVAELCAAGALVQVDGEVRNAG